MKSFHQKTLFFCHELRSEIHFAIHEKKDNVFDEKTSWFECCLFRTHETKSKLHFKQVCGQCGYEKRAHRKLYDSRGKHFDNLEGFC